MFVVKTISQLKEAIRENAREVMVVGKLAPEMLERKDLSFAGDDHEFTADVSFTNLFDNFNILAVYDSSQNVRATVFQQRDSLSMP